MRLQGTQGILRCLQCNDERLTSLDLSKHHLSDDAGVLLGNCLRYNTKLVRLRLDQNRIGPFGTFRLAKGLRCNDSSALQELSISYNRFGNEGAVALARMLPHQEDMTYLVLDGNHIGNEGVIALADALSVGSTTMQQLSLRDNFIGTAGAQALARMLETNTSLRHIDLGRNNIGPEGYRALRDALRDHNTTLMELSVDDTIGGLGWDAELRAEIHFYTALNRRGRRSIRDVMFPTGLWPKILSRLPPELMYVFLSERPDLLCQRTW